MNSKSEIYDFYSIYDPYSIERSNWSAGMILPVRRSLIKALLESRFGLEMEKKDFDNMLRRVPLDKKGNVRYPEFLATFDAGRFDNKSLWEVKTIFFREP